MSSDEPLKPTDHQSRLGVPIYVVGAMGAVGAMGLSWLVLEPPLVTTGWTSLPLLVVAMAAVIPVLAMLWGTLQVWSQPTSPRSPMLVFALVAAGLLWPEAYRASADLPAGEQWQAVTVLGVYNCDRTAPSGEILAALTCVELAWERPNGRQGRDRFTLGSEVLDETVLRRGGCAKARFWGHLERLVAIEPAPHYECTEE